MKRLVSIRVPRGAEERIAAGVGIVTDEIDASGTVERLGVDLQAQRFNWAAVDCCRSAVTGRMLDPQPAAVALHVARLARAPADRLDILSERAVAACCAPVFGLDPD